MAPIRPILREADLTDQQWRILSVLVERGGVTNGVLSEEALLHSASAVKIVSDLRTRSLIKPAGQGRGAIIEITDAGRRQFEDVSAKIAIVLGLYANLHGAKHLSTLQLALRKFIKGIGRGG